MSPRMQSSSARMQPPRHRSSSQRGNRSQSTCLPRTATQQPEAEEQQLALESPCGPQTAGMNQGGGRAASNRLPSPRSLLSTTDTDRIMNSLLRSQSETSGPLTAGRSEVMQIEDKKKDDDTDSFSMISGVTNVQERSSDVSGSWVPLSESPEKTPSVATGSTCGPLTAGAEGSSERTAPLTKNEKMMIASGAGEGSGEPLFNPPKGGAREPSPLVSGVT